MVSMWGSKKKDDDSSDVPSNIANNDGGGSSRPASSDFRNSHEANERTGLISNSQRPRGDGYLDPDDPAISADNLWTVRFIRTFTVLFAAITGLWFAVLFVSIFVSPPGLNTRGSGFTDFAYTCLTLGLLLTTLLFFKLPSLAMRVLLGVVSFLLLVDMIIIVSVKRIRQEENWVGIASVVWAVLMGFWCILTDRVVEWGKHEEEERLTGRPETKRTLKEWLGVFTATIILAVYIAIAVLMTATLILRSIDAGLEPDGERFYVDSDKYEVHLACFGTVTNTNGMPDPTIMIESGEEPSEHDFEHWAYNAVQNGTISRYCYWDRPGYAWSDDAPSPHSAGMSADALSEALAKAGETGPWISVSAGFGSIVARIWAARQVNKLTGIMMIDPWHEDILNRLASPSKGFTIWGYGILSPLGIQRLGGALFNGRTKEDRVYGRSVMQTGKFLKVKLQENLVADSLSKSEVSSARTIQSRKTPLVVVSSGIEAGRDTEWSRKQDDMSHYTDNLVAYDIVSKAPHQVWQTYEGRQAMEKGLGELMEAAKSR